MKNKQKNYHFDHLQQQILIILNKTIVSEIYDQLIKQVTFTGLKLSKDYSQAIIYVDCYERSKLNSVLCALKKAKGKFRTVLAKQLTIKKVPNLFFTRDKAIDNSQQVEQILQTINKK